jgi:CubicO group peptidase (beta-lactamase class C family)
MARASSVKAAGSCRFGVGIDAEFVVVAPEVLDERVAGADHASGAELFQSAHRPQSGLEPTVIGFDGIVCVLLYDMARDGQQLIEHSWIAAARSVVTSVGRTPCSRA